MYTTRRSDLDSESLKRSAQNLTISNRRSTTIGNVHRQSVYYPAVSETPPVNPSINRPTSMTRITDHRRSTNEFISPYFVPSPGAKPPREVSLRVKFIRLGEVITLEEKFYAEIVIEARWLYDSDHANWNPNLYVKNALGDVKQEVVNELVDSSDMPIDANYKTDDDDDDDIIYVFELRKVVGTFWETLELNSFPVDVQQLSLQIVTRCSIEECVLVENRFHPSIVHREAFLAQQEWFLYEHIETRSTITTEDFSFRPMRQSTYLVTCYVARRPGYFYWNVYLLTFLITLITLMVYGVAPDLPQNRLQITCTLLLTLIMFRWSVSRLLPPVSYLTLLDKYTLISLVFISLNSIWHSIIGFLIRQIGVSIAIDHYVLCIFTGFFVLFHFIMGISLSKALHHRHVMLEHDRKYATKLAGMFETFARGHHAVQRFKDRQHSSRTSLFV